MNIHLAFRAEWLAGHVKNQKKSHLPLCMFHAESYSMLVNDSDNANKILNLYQENIENDLTTGICSARKFFDK